MIPDVLQLFYAYPDRTLILDNLFSYTLILN